MAAQRKDKPVTPAQFAELLDIPAETARRWCYDRKVRCLKVGGTWFIAGSEVARVRDGLGIAS